MNHPTNITLKMLDLGNNETVERTIDISNIFRNCHINLCWVREDRPEKQVELLNQWINERGNDQHDTFLELISYTIH